jgi:hypothetical protein
MKNSQIQGLPSWSKGIIAIAVTGAAAFIGYKIYKLLANKGDAEERERQKEVEASLNKQIVKQGVRLNPTYNTNQYIAYADSIFNELNGFGAGRADVVERALMDMKNELDVLNLIKAYGKRQRTVLGIEKGGKEELLTALASEWTSVQNSSRKKVNNDWANKNIKYRII